MRTQPTCRKTNLYGSLYRLSEWIIVESAMIIIPKSRNPSIRNTKDLSFLLNVGTVFGFITLTSTQWKYRQRRRRLRTTKISELLLSRATRAVQSGGGQVQIWTIFSWWFLQIAAEADCLFRQIKILRRLGEKLPPGAEKQLITPRFPPKHATLRFP